MSSKEYGPAILAAYHDAQRIHDVEQAHAAALAEHEQREALLARLADLKRQVDEAKFAADIRAEHDDGPGRDQHGEHRGAAYIVDPREMVGLPAPDYGAVASLNTRLTLGRILVEHRRGDSVDTADAIEQILALFAGEASPPASHEGPTVSAAAAVVAERFQGGEQR